MERIIKVNYEDGVITPANAATRFFALLMTMAPESFKPVLREATFTEECGEVVSVFLRDRDSARALNHQYREMVLAAMRGVCGVGQVNLNWAGNTGRPLPIAALEEPTNSTQTGLISAWGAPHLRPDAGTGEVLDFIKAHQAPVEEGGAGLVVTVTSMVNHRCLSANQLQALDRGSGWTTHKWIGLNFLTLWVDSFKPGRVNYLGQLLEGLAGDNYIPDFYYQIRRPSGALAEYSTSYYLVRDFMGGGPARVAVSAPGAWRIVETAEDGSND